MGVSCATALGSLCVVCACNSSTYGNYLEVGPGVVRAIVAGPSRVSNSIAVWNSGGGTLGRTLGSHSNRTGVLRIGVSSNMAAYGNMSGIVSAE